MISGSSSQALTTQTSHVVKSFNAESRDVIISKLDHIIKIPPEQMSAMKTCLSLPWNLVREIRRWLGSFKINVASTGSMRNVVNDWDGTGLHTEEIQATVKKNKHSFIVLKPWCYIYNLVGYVLKYMDELKENNYVFYDGGIPASEIHLKIGGDHGGQSFKMSFQVANVHNPNKPENSVIFSVMEAKDYKSNLQLCLERFRRQIEQFKKVTWQGRKFVVFSLAIMIFSVPCMDYLVLLGNTHVYAAQFHQIICNFQNTSDPKSTRRGHKRNWKKIWKFSTIIMPAI